MTDSHIIIIRIIIAWVGSGSSHIIIIRIIIGWLGSGSSHIIIIHSIIIRNAYKCPKAN